LEDNTTPEKLFVEEAVEAPANEVFMVSTQEFPLKPGW
jgi:hypothetical protein